MLRPNLSNYSHAYTVVKRRTSFRGPNDPNKRNKKVTFKNNPPFRSCIPKINTFIDNEENLDIIMPMYNLLECRDNIL